MPKVTMLPLAAAIAALPAGITELVGLADDVVGREHQHQRLTITLGGEQGRDRNCGTRIAAHRLQHDISIDAAFAQLLGDDEAEVAMGDDDRSPEQLRIRDAREHLLKRRALSDQGDELLWPALARNRPQPRSGAAAHDHRNDLSRHEQVLRLS